jgi:hypothetical protein
MALPPRLIEMRSRHSCKGRNTHHQTTSLQESIDASLFADMSGTGSPTPASRHEGMW